MISFVKILSGFYTHDSDISINDAALSIHFTDLVSQILF